MNHYLQRMALSAIKPGGTIHPIVDSVYSTRKDYSYKPWIDENDSVAETRVAQGPAGSQSSEMPAIMAAPLQPTRIADASPLPKPIIDKIEPALVEQSRSSGSGPSFAPKVKSETVAAAENPNVLVAGSKRKAEITGQEIREEVLSREDQRTAFLMPEIDPAPDSDRLPQIVPPGRNPGAFKPKTTTSARPETLASEPDDIQIHIGRIEVIAVPPAPAPAAGKSQRNVPSLDEYLKRRDRRAP